MLLTPSLCAVHYVPRTYSSHYGNVALWTAFHPFCTQPYLLSLATTSVLSVSRRWFLCFVLDSMVSEIIQYLSFSVWLISWCIWLSMMPSKFIDVVVSGRLAFFYGWTIFYCSRGISLNWFCFSAGNLLVADPVCNAFHDWMCWLLLILFSLIVFSSCPSLSHCLQWEWLGLLFHLPSRNISVHLNKPMFLCDVSRDLKMHRPKWHFGVSKQRHSLSWRGIQAWGFGWLAFVILPSCPACSWTNR